MCLRQERQLVRERTCPLHQESSQYIHKECWRVEPLSKIGKGRELGQFRFVCKIHEEYGTDYKASRALCTVADYSL